MPDLAEPADQVIAATRKWLERAVIGLQLCPFAIAPHLLLDACAAAVAELGFKGELQVASFHPRYQFAGTGVQDIENYTNRSPYPMLHLLREASVARAVANFPYIDRIGATNQETLRRLGHEGWRQLGIT